ncbi:hypothetical protein J437_LFUL006750 [Ladona fulva]|uniref:Platelet-derived growth factor (PDGF) family profile domain-containing protein n=1 Tax=Ladona fulva TaxID=123851 RepID=A0A8K0K0L3_LADFU|nr:hypothetical protein J437_LFUL006750 [Ladona fulva]
MKATVRFVLFCTICFFQTIQCKAGKSLFKIEKRYAYDEKPHEFKHYDECSHSFRKSFHGNLMKYNCMPRPTIVELITSSPSMLLIPSRVLVNRCSGECHAKQSCLATNSTHTTFEVQQMSILDDTLKCGVVHVEEHARCSCKCTVMKEHCNEKQIYKPGECMCYCINDEERERCNATPGRFWDDDQCTCQCHAKKDCSTGLVWVPEHCSCAKLMQDEENEVDIVYQD